jgi:hypothetical protein
MLDQQLSQCVDRAIRRVFERCRQAPAAGAAFRSWASHLSATTEPGDYFGGGRAVMLVLPWWLEKRIRPAPDIEFQERLVESTISAYYFVRLIDNVMDENGANERALLPVLGLLHSTFIREYARLFPSDARFWDHFDRYWAATAEAAIREKALSRLSADDFFTVAARKTSGIKIPLAAVCCRYNRMDLLEPWCAFHDRLACWQQMADDAFDWVHDLRHGNATFFLSEARRRKHSAESVSGWVIRGGFAWAISWLDESMRELRRHAEQLESPELARFLTYRDGEIRDRWLDLRSKLVEVARLVDVFECATESVDSS